MEGPLLLSLALSQSLSPGDAECLTTGCAFNIHFDAGDSIVMLNGSKADSTMHAD